MANDSGRCKHRDVRLFTREGAEHTGLDLFARCTRCGFEGIDFPHIEHNPGEVTAKMRRDLLEAFHKDTPSVSGLSHTGGDRG